MAQQVSKGLRGTASAALLALAAAAPIVHVGAAESSPGSATLQVRGRQLLDTCGAPVVVRGVEQVVGIGMEVPQIGGNHLALVDEIAATGANAVRLLPDLAAGQLDLQRVDALFERAVRHGMIVYWSPYASSGTLDKRAFWERPDVKALVHKWRQWLIIDAFQEPNYDDRVRWKSDAIAAIRHVRAQGYVVPVTVMANRAGRDLPSALEHGSAIVSSDPLGRTILGWQAYWGSSRYYQREYGMTLAQGVRAAAKQPFPIQVGLDYQTDPGETAEFADGMDAAKDAAIGWLWWDYHNPFWPVNSLSRDGTHRDLRSPFGATVVQTHPGSIQRTSRKVCKVRG